MRTLENFFKNGLTNNLTNRVFKLFYGTLCEETVVAAKRTGRSFHDLVMSRHMSLDEFRRTVEQQDGTIPEKFLGPTTILHSMPEKGKGMFDKPYIEQSPNQVSPQAMRRIGLLDNPRRLIVSLEETPEEMRARLGRVIDQSFQSVGHRAATYELRAKVEAHAATETSADNGHKADPTRELHWQVGKTLVTEGVARKWLFDSLLCDADHNRYAESIWYLIQDNPTAREFVSACLRKLHAIRLSDVSNLPNIRHMNMRTFWRYVAGLRPLHMATTAIVAAMHHVRSFYPEAKYVWFDGDLQWHYLDTKMDCIVLEQDGLINLELLEDAVLEAADRGLMNQPLHPNLA